MGSLPCSSIFVLMILFSSCCMRGSSTGLSSPVFREVLMCSTSILFQSSETFCVWTVQFCVMFPESQRSKYLDGTFDDVVGSIQLSVKKNWLHRVDILPLLVSRWRFPVVFLIYFITYISWVPSTTINFLGVMYNDRFFIIKVISNKLLHVNV